MFVFGCEFSKGLDERQPKSISESRSRVLGVGKLIHCKIHSLGWRFMELVYVSTLTCSALYRVEAERNVCVLN